MARIPNRVQGQPFGTVNQTNPNQNLPANPVSILQPGPSQAREQFNRPGIPLEVARALNSLQESIHQATQQVKADPTANKQMFEQVTLEAGSGGGVAPFVSIQHGLGGAYRGYRLGSVRNGSVFAHAAITPTSGQPASLYLILWTLIEPFGSDPVTADIEVWA